MLWGVGVGVGWAGVVGAAIVGDPVTTMIVFSAPGTGVVLSNTMVPLVGIGVSAPGFAVLPLPQSFHPLLPLFAGVGVAVGWVGKICWPWLVPGVSTTTVSGVMVTVAVGCRVRNGRLFPAFVAPALFVSSGAT